jgi:[ribosomal protein S5]-alanine N-acetyltransferase
MITPRMLTPDVELRVAALDDDAAFADAYTFSWGHLQPWEPERPEQWFTATGQRERLDGALEDYSNGQVVPWVLVERGRIIGAITLTNIARGPFRSASLGYWLAVDVLGRGLATRAVEAVAEIADTELNLHRIEASTLVNNVTSQRVLDRAGFVKIGLAPTYLHIAGAWRDCNLYQRILNETAPGA